MALPPGHDQQDAGVSRGRRPRGAACRYLGGPVLMMVAALSGCRGPQSSLEPAGRGAERIAELFWWMSAGAVVVWLLVAWLAWSAMRGRASTFNARRAHFYIIGGGAVLPTVVLTGLLVYGLGMMPELLQPAPAGALRVTVVGEQWWWRVRYHLDDGRQLETANEVRLPVDRPVEFLLESPDVIHAFADRSSSTPRRRADGSCIRRSPPPTSPASGRICGCWASRSSRWRRSPPPSSSSSAR